MTSSKPFSRTGSANVLTGEKIQFLLTRAPMNDARAAAPSRLAVVPEATEKHVT
jgi:hypothetical protein